MSVKNYLQRRNGTYYFRKAVPEDVRHVFLTKTGKPATEWVWSLKIKDYDSAKRLANRDDDKTAHWIKQARDAMAAVEPEPVPVQTEEQSAAVRALVDRMERMTIEAAEYFEKLDFENEMRAEQDPLFAQELDLRAAKGRERQRLQEAEDALELRAQLRAGQQVSLTGLFEKYAAMQGRHPKTIAQWRPYIAKLAVFIGTDDALLVTRKKLIEWRNHLRDEVTFRGKRLSPKTINDSYLGAAGALFAWATGDGLLDGNPMDGVSKINLPTVPQLREKAFNIDEVRTILRATTLPSSDRTGRAWRDAKRWCPWLLAYSGARANEITQLRKEDVINVEGVHALRLTPEAGTIKAKKARLVPLHSHLIEQGFLEFVLERPEGPLFYDPELRRTANAINRQANRLGSKLATWVGSLGIAGVKPNHGWRHLFNTLAAKYELDHRATMALLGHSSGNVNQRYGSVPIDALSRAVEKLPNFQTHT